MAALTTRRVVTGEGCNIWIERHSTDTPIGHNAEGKAIFLQDDSLVSLNPMTGSPPEGSTAGITNICKTEGIPPSINTPFVDYYGKLIPLVDASGIYCRVCHFLPVSNPEEDTLNIEHRTQSIDFGVVLEGEIQLTLDDGEKKILRKGDVVVQRGTMHVWFVSLILQFRG